VAETAEVVTDQHEANTTKTNVIEHQKPKFALQFPTRKKQILVVPVEQSKPTLSAEAVITESQKAIKHLKPKFALQIPMAEPVAQQEMTFPMEATTKQTEEPQMTCGKLEEFIAIIHCLQKALKVDEKSKRMIEVFKKGLTKMLLQAMMKN